jgi:hypothetical protein
VSKLKDKVEEFAEIAKALPENLQATCFELLLKNHLDTIGGPPSKQPATTAPPAPPALSGPLPAAAATPFVDVGAKQEDLKATDLHVKAKKFLSKHNLSLDHLNNLFFKEEGQFKPLYEDLKTTRMSESQIRVSLLIALRAALATGEFNATIEAIREECTERKCYDTSNFSNNFNNNKTLFDFAKFDKTVKSVSLSESGRKELADVIQELQ